MATDHVQLVVDELGAQGYNAAGGGLPDGAGVDTRVVGVRPDGGIDPDHHIGSNEPAIKRPTVQILVRDRADKAGRGWSDALAIHTLLDENQLSPALDLIAQESAPEALADESDGAVIYNMNFEFLLVE